MYFQKTRNHFFLCSRIRKPSKICFDVVKLTDMCITSTFDEVCYFGVMVVTSNKELD